MCQALMELMKDEVQAKVDMAVKEAVEENTAEVTKSVTKSVTKNVTRNVMRSTTITNIRNLMESLGLDADEAMNALKIPENERNTIYIQLKR